jgi:predicted glycoside hydrolase/deacetylase ChbG (UPF0249 family)
MAYLDLMQIFSPSQSYEFAGRRATLVEHLGYPAESRLAIIGADDLGLCDSVNTAVLELADAGQISSTSLLVTGTGATSAIEAAVAGRIACGIHITLNSDFDVAPVKSISTLDSGSSLLDESGCLSLDVNRFASHARAEEVEQEAVAQIELAQARGITISHLDSHEGTLQLNEQFVPLYLSLAARFRLPLRMGSPALLKELGLSVDWLNRARELGLHFPDNLVYIPLYAFPTVAEKEAHLEQVVAVMPPGVTEFYFHPSHDTESARRLLPSSPQARSLPDPELAWQVRFNDYDLLRAGRFHSMLEKREAQIIDFSSLRSLVRD